MTKVKLGLMVGLLLAGGLRPAPVLAETTYTDDMVRKMFETKEARDVHGAMAGQREKLREIQDGFLTGDFEAIKKNAGELANNMRDVSAALPAQVTNSNEAWMAMYRIVSEAQSLKEEVDKKNYESAYGHYSDMIGQCIRCHQMTRDWGKFEEPELAREVSESSGQPAVKASAGRRPTEKKVGT